jgi:tetratricopeptide (TPR) repeat protein
MMAAVVFLVAVTVRLLHLFAFRDTALFDVLMGDARAYDAWAQRIAADDWVGTEVFYQAPLYPYFLGAIYAIAGRDLLIVRLVQALIGSASAVLLALAAERMTSRRVGWVAGLGLALYAPAIFLDLLLQKSVLDLFFICLTLWLVAGLIAAPTRTGLWAGLGAALGALSLTRENALALVLVAIAWAVSKDPTHEAHEGHEGRHEEHEGRQGGHEKTKRRKRHRESELRERTYQQHRQLPGVFRDLRGPLRVVRVPVVALLLGLVAVLLPVVTRNYAVTGGFYLTTSQFGPNFFIGNNPAADGTYIALKPGRGAPEYERQDATELSERALGRSLTPAEVSSYWTDRALAFIANEPGRWAALMARKVALLWNRSEMLDTESQETYEEESPVLRVLARAGHFGVVVPLAALGLIAAWPDRRRLWPVLALLAAYAASVVVFYVFARYRFPMVPFLILLAALGATTARGLFAAWSASRRAIAVGGLLLVAIAVNWPLLSSTRMRAITETNLGTALHEAGRLDEAVARYEKAVAIQSDYAPAYNNLGVTLRAQGKVDAAIAAYERGLRLDEAYPDLHYNLANALLAQNRADEAAAHLKTSLSGEPASAATHNNLGTALAAKGQYEQAVAEFRTAIALDPTSVLAHRNLGNAFASMGRGAEALVALERAVALAPTDAEANYDLGSLLLGAGRFPDAVARFRASLAANPRSVETLNNLGIALASQGQLREAAALFEQALAIDPSFADAQKNLATAKQALGK